VLNFTHRIPQPTLKGEMSMTKRFIIENICYDDVDDTIMYTIIDRVGNTVVYRSFDYWTAFEELVTLNAEHEKNLEKLLETA
jgi:hypothetical protein